MGYPGSEVPLQRKRKKGQVLLASLARPADGFSDLGRLGLVLKPVIQGSCGRVPLQNHSNS